MSGVGRWLPLAAAVSFVACGCRTAAPAPAGPTLDDESFESWRARKDPSYGWNERVALHLGARSMDDEFLPGTSNDTVVGLEISGAPRGSPLEFVLGLFGSGGWSSTFEEDEGVGFGAGETLSTGAAEISFGLRLAPHFEGIPIVPHAGLGVAGIRVQREELFGGEEVRRSDSSGAVYAHAGLTWLGQGGWTLTVEYRELFASDLRLGDEVGDGDYSQVSVALGVWL